MFQWIAIILGSYVLASLFFFIFPTLLHNKKQLKNPLFVQALSTNKVLNIAHRGGPRHATQNTIEVFTLIQKYTNCFQMDVCETADNILVVHHDHHLKRTCGIDRDVQSFKYDQLPPFASEIVLDFGVKQIIKSKKQRIPKLEDVFKKFPHILMNIQLKTPTPTAMTEFSRLIFEYNRTANTIVGIRNNQNQALKKKHPQILNFFNDKKVFRLAISYFLGFVAFLPIQQSSLQIPVYSKQFQQWNVGRTNQQDKWKVRLFMRAIKVLNIITRPLIWHLKRRGILSLGWVCNTQQSFDHAIRSGFQGIMTDDPIILNSYLKTKNLSIES